MPGLKDLPRTEFGSGFAVTGADLSGNTGIRRVQTMLPDTGTVGTIPTTGAVSCKFITPVAGTLTNFRLCGHEALAASASNFITFTAVNKGQNGAGTTQMLATSTTIANGLAVDTGVSMAPSAVAGALTVAANDIIIFTATVTGTLPNTVTDVVVSAGFIPS